MPYPLTEAGYAGLRMARGLQLADLWKLRRRDGYELRLTNWNGGLTYEGQLYSPAILIANNGTRMESGLKESAVDVQSIIDGTSVTIPDLRGRLYEGASLEHKIIDARNPLVLLRADRYWVSNITEDGQLFKGTLENQVAQMQQPIGGYFGANFTIECQFQLGGPKCKKDVSADVYTGVTVNTVTLGRERNRFQATVGSWPGGSPARTDGYYADGVVEWTSGANANQKRPIVYYGHSTRDVELLLPTVYPIAPGDQCTVRPGCDGQRQTCLDKFNNVINFGGSPYDPGADALVSPQVIPQ